VKLFLYFVLFAVFGVAFEVFWVSLLDFLKTHNPRLKGRSSLWMFPIYGCLLFVVMFVRGVFPSCPWWFRGVVYVVLILVLEYLSGAFVRGLTGVAPWDYERKTSDGVGSPKRYNIDGLVCLEYVPLWFFGGLAAELFFLFLESHIIL